MKILLLGEFSGFYKNLKEGLTALGHEVDLISAGDGWKEIGGNNSAIKLFSNQENRYIRYTESTFLQLKNISRLKDYDVVQVMVHDLFGVHFNKTIHLIKRLKENNGKIFLSLPGDDYYIYKASKSMRYNVYQDSNYDDEFAEKKYRHNNKEVIQLMDGLIPIMYTYAEAHRTNEKLLNTIPLPINSDLIEVVPQKIENGKLNIFHGINRGHFKGTKYIREAMEQLANDYPNDVEILIDGEMPLAKYLGVLKKSNVVIDQALSYEYGMNALYAMALGKAVVGGNEPEVQQEFGRKDIPVINILPDAEDIYNKLETLVLNKESVIELGRKSRLFVEDFHNYITVADRYVDTWNSVE